MTNPNVMNCLEFTVLQFSLIELVSVFCSPLSLPADLVMLLFVPRDD